MEPDLRQYPIGPWVAQLSYSPDEIAGLITQLRALPLQYRVLTEPLTDADLERAYRPGSWTVRQLVHHVADTHQWHYFRIKHALTVSEIQPGIVSTMNDWATQPDARYAPINLSIQIMTGLHKRLAHLLESLPYADWQRAYYHPFRQVNVTLQQALHMMVWHASHHLAHIRLATGQ